MPYSPPEIGKSSFNCPHCGAFSHQAWKDLYTVKETGPIPKSHDDLKVEFVLPPKKERGYTEFTVHIEEQIANLRASRCAHCNRPSIWWGALLVHPQGSKAPDAHVDMPATTRIIYDEARAVYRDSPRAAAGLLRLALEDLLRALEVPGESLAARILSLREQGLPPELTHAMEVVRITGNDALHAGEIRLHEDAEVAPILFDILNTIVQNKVTFQKKVRGIMERIPDKKKPFFERAREKIAARPEDSTDVGR